MGKKLIPRCCICHEDLDYKPTRLVRQEYGAGKYEQYYNVKNYDVCDTCIKKFDSWIKKHKEGGNEKNI